MADGLPPGVIEVSRTPGDKPGSFWVLGSDGGVFAVGGASFHGSYPQIAATQQGTRGNWKTIRASGSGGYIISDDKGGNYEFNPPPDSGPTKNVVSDPAAATQAPVDLAAQATAAAKAQSDASGSAVLQKALGDFGLGALGGDLLAYFRGEGKGSLDATMLKLRDSPEYKARFPGMAARQQAGLNAIDENTYLAWESGAKAQLTKYGLPADFYSTPDALAQFITGDVSVPELTSRIEKGYNDAMAAPPETRNALQSMYGVDAGHMAAFFLDPKVGQDTIQRKFVASQIGGESTIAGFGALTAAEAEKLGAGGMTDKTAQQAFGQLGQEAQLTTDLTREEQLAAAGGDTAAQAKIKGKAAEKTAGFQGGGGFSQSQKGVSGLGTSNG